MALGRLSGLLSAHVMDAFASDLEPTLNFLTLRDAIASLSLAIIGQPV
jgi:hypothetical protein